MIALFADPATKRAFASAVMISFSGAPLGVFLVLRRMSLMGDVIAHAILPGTAAGFILAGLSLPVMGAGGLIAGLIVALLASLATRYTAIREDANLATFYMVALAAGVAMLAAHGTAQNLEDILFGDVSAVSRETLIAMTAASSVTLFGLAVIYRPLVIEAFDPVFLQSVGGRGGLYQGVFMALTVLTMVEGYRTLGTLMASDLIIIPAVTAQFWTRRLPFLMLWAVAIGIVSSAVGIMIAARYGLPSGPAIILVVGGIYFLSALFGSVGSLRARYFPPHHLEA